MGRSYFFSTTGSPQRPSAALYIRFGISANAMAQKGMPYQQAIVRAAPPGDDQSILLSGKEQAGGLQMWLWNFLQSFGCKLFPAIQTSTSQKQPFLSQKTFLDLEFVDLQLCTR